MSGMAACDVCLDAGACGRAGGVCEKRSCPNGGKLNLILEKTDQVNGFTDMRDVFDALNMAPEDYDWYVSDIRTNWTPAGFSPIDQWMSGEDLASFLRMHVVWFEWGVFSAVPKGFRSTPASTPYADGNPDYWTGPEPAPQLEGALFEITCWDSSAIILIDLPAQPAAAFMARYTDTKSLAAARTSPQ
jgi:hypothetical protein